MNKGLGQKGAKSGRSVGRIKIFGGPNPAKSRKKSLSRGPVGPSLAKKVETGGISGKSAKSGPTVGRINVFRWTMCAKSRKKSLIPSPIPYKVKYMVWYCIVLYCITQKIFFFKKRNIFPRWLTRARFARGVCCAPQRENRAKMKIKIKIQIKIKIK